MSLLKVNEQVMARLSYGACKSQGAITSPSTLPLPSSLTYQCSVWSRDSLRGTLLATLPTQIWILTAQAFDLAIDEDAKRRWQRAKPLGMVVGLPGYLVGGEWHGVSQFEGGRGGSGQHGVALRLRVNTATDGHARWTAGHPVA